uniref:ANAPC4_WD40 domain-containing protein n=1 Tax=Heterorhabditis bacteriophora TaxID=37862 RepID=A0A1I7XT96_HETBA
MEDSALNYIERMALFSPFIETQEAEDEEVEDTEDNEIEDNSSDLPVSKSQKRRDRRLRMQKMLAVMKRGRFHEIQEMQKEYLNREVGAFPDFTTPKPGCIESIAWSPDGNVLAVSMNDGHYHLIDVEHGQIRWTRLISVNNYAQRLRWCASDNRLGIPRSDGVKKEIIREEDKAIANILGHKDDVANERLQRTLFLETLYSRSLRNTLLFMVRDDMMIVVVAGGIMPICEINLGHSLLVSVNITFKKSQNHFILATYGLDIITIYDVLYSIPENGVTIACTSYGPRPHFREGGMFGSPVLIEKTSQVPSHAHSHLVNVSMKIDNERLIWEIVESLRLGESLLAGLLSGVHGIIAETWLERALGAQGIAGMREFLDKRFSGLIALLRGQMSSSARALAFQMESFREQIQLLKEGCLNDFECFLLPQRNMNVGVYPFGGTGVSEEPTLATRPLETARSRAIMKRLHEDGIKIQAKCHEMVTAVTNNLRELSLLVRWMSLLGPLIKNTKRPLQVIQHSRKWDIPKLLKYIVDTFIPQKELQEYLNTSMFDIDRLLQEMREEETHENFDEEEYMKDLSMSDDSPYSSKGHRRSLEDMISGRIDSKSLPRLVLSSSPTTTQSPSSFVLTTESCTTPNISTPKTNKPSGGPEYKMDKIYHFWGQELNEATLDLLGDRCALMGLECIIDSTRKSLNTVIQDALATVREAGSILRNVVGECPVASFEWMCELASSESHCGFDNCTLTQWKWLDRMVEADLLEKHCRNLKGNDLSEGICVVLVKDVTFIYHIVLPRKNGQLSPGIQDDMTIKISGKETEKEFGRIVKFISGHPFPGGHVYAVGSFPSELLDSVFLSPVRQKGCSLSEEGSRVSLFLTRNTSDESVSTDSHDRSMVEEYRRFAAMRERAASRPDVEPAYFHVFDGDTVMRVQVDTSEVIDLTE